MTQNKKDRFIHSLRTAELQAKRECRHYKLLYSQECRKTKVLLKEINKLRKQIADSKRKNELVSSKNSQLTQQHETKVTRKRKCWTQLKCERTKHQRVSEYGSSVLNTINVNFSQCKRAQLSLFMGDKTVNFSWTSKDMQKCSNAQQSALQFSNMYDHSYACSKLVDHDSKEDDIADIDYNSIFDSEGKWQPKHKRSIITVMDCYRISHEAYHELRLAGKRTFSTLVPNKK